MTTLVLNPTTDTCAQEDDPSGWNDSWVELWINTNNATGHRCRGLYRFDLSTLAGTTINSAALQLTVNYEGDTKTITVHRIAAANSGWDGGANWYTANGESLAWAGSYGCGASGADYVATAMASLSVSSTGAKTWNLNTTEFASLIAANHGIVLLSTDGPSYADYTKTATKEDATSSKWPTLTIDYTAGGAASIVPILNSYRQRRA